MTIADLVTLCQNRITQLQAARDNHWAAGDVLSVASVDLQIAQAENTLTALQSLLPN
ncbi:MAG: hypothetical protein ACK52K_17010 [Alphaproteobacteria bacterium]|jgi:hypothetical protein